MYSHIQQCIPYTTNIAYEMQYQVIESVMRDYWCISSRHISDFSFSFVSLATYLLQRFINNLMLFWCKIISRGAKYVLNVWYIYQKVYDWDYRPYQGKRSLNTLCFFLCKMQNVCFELMKVSFSKQCFTQLFPYACVIL